jgi:hypothetical protein
MEQRVNIKCCVKLGKTPIETYEILQTAYGDEALSHSSVFEWFKRFKDGREDLQDNSRSRCPSSSRNADIIANVREMVMRDRRLTLRMMLNELNIYKETIRQILQEELWKREICAKFVPHFIQTCQDNLSILNCTVTGDES